MLDSSKSLELGIYRYYWDDGLLDLFAGVGVGVIGLSWAYHLIPLGAIVPALLIPLWKPVRQALIEPMAGRVEFSDSRVERVRHWGVSAFWLGIVTFGLGVAIYSLVVAGSVPAPSRYIAGLPAFLLALLAVIAAFGLGLRRFLFYALVLVIGGLVVVSFGLEPEAAMITGGLVAALGGVRRLHRFLRSCGESDGAFDEGS